MSGKIDLHLHSNRSDGTLQPIEVVGLCAATGITTIALSDHDTIDGIAEAIAEGKRLGVEVLPAIELSAGNYPELHILGYFPDIYETELNDWLDELRNKRMLRAAHMVARLRELGFALTLDDVQAEAIPHAGLGRTHMAKALVRKGYAADIPDAFERFLKPGKSGYISRNNPPADEVLKKLSCLGIVPVLAHGALIDAPITRINHIIDHMVEHGLLGLECYHAGYNHAMERFMLDQAKSRGLLVTGGSDYHGENRRGILPGDGLSKWQNSKECLAQLKAARR